MSDMGGFPSAGLPVFKDLSGVTRSVVVAPGALSAYAQEWRSSAGAVISAISTAGRFQAGPTNACGFAGRADTNYFDFYAGGGLVFGLVSNRIDCNVPISVAGAYSAVSRAIIGSVTKGTIPTIATNAGSSANDLAFGTMNGLNHATETYRQGDGMVFVCGSGGNATTGDANGGNGGNFSVIVKDGGTLSGAGANGLNGAFRVQNAAGTTRFSVDSAGRVICAALPTSDPGVAGALWNDSGTIKVSP